MNCKEKGYSYDTVADAYGCKIVKCVEAAATYGTTTANYCPTQEELDKYVGFCKSQNLSYDMVPDDYGCKTVKCLEQFKARWTTTAPTSTVLCISDAEITKQITMCKEEGGTYDIGVDSYGCKMVKCQAASTPSTGVTSEQKCQTPYIEDMIKNARNQIWAMNIIWKVLTVHQ